jgi:hypothetical protein
MDPPYAEEYTNEDMLNPSWDVKDARYHLFSCQPFHKWTHSLCG